MEQLEEIRLDWPNHMLISEYARARSETLDWTKRKNDVRAVILPRLRERKGRLIARTGTALLRIENRTHVDRQLLNYILMMNRALRELVAPAISVQQIEKVMVDVLPENIWEQAS